MWLACLDGEGLLPLIFPSSRIDRQLCLKDIHLEGTVAGRCCLTRNELQLPERSQTGISYIFGGFDGNLSENVCEKTCFSDRNKMLLNLQEIASQLESPPSTAY